MKSLISIIPMILLSISLFAQNIKGEWNTGLENTIVDITQSENGHYNGKIASSDNSNVKTGRLILKELIKTNNGYKGKIYAVRRKNWYDCTITPKPDKLEIKIKAGIRSKTTYWSKTT